MKQHKMLVGLVFIFLFQNPLALAITCNFVSPANYDSCMEILNSGITDQEKEMLISNLDYTSKTFPDHEYIFDINANKEITSATVGTEIHNKEYIKNVWVDILSLIPSVLYNGSLYAPEKSSVLTGFNYDLKIPENYYSSGYPNTKNGDCRTLYSITNTNAENKIYVNEKYAGTGDLVDLTLEKDSQIKSEYLVNLELSIRHYDWDRYCSSRRADGSCRRYSYRCLYESTETKKEEVKIDDTLDVKLYKNNLFAELEPINIYDGTTNLKINYSDSVWIDFADSKYHYNKYIYSINYSKAPYYILTLKAEDYNQQEISNLFAGNNILTLKNTLSCKLKYFDFFSSVESDCNTQIESLDFFIKTDKLKYKKGEEIKVKIFPSDVNAKISYGEEIVTAKGNVNFIADYDSNKITAEYKGLKSEKIIFISNRERMIIIWNLVVFTFLNYFLYLVLRRYSEKIKWQKNADY